MQVRPIATCQGCLVPRHMLTPVHSGENFEIVSPAESALVTKDVAEELQRVLEQFGGVANWNGSPKVTILFRPGIFGHHRLGRAIDIYEVGGLGIDLWKRRWDEAKQRAERASNPLACKMMMNSERRLNLGWLLYKTLQRFGRWSKPCGYPVQLFGPWTRTEGPWRGISDFLLHAHRDHIHVAK